MAHLQEKAEWRCVLEGDMAQCVMTSGIVWMPELSVDNWDSMTLVCEHISICLLSPNSKIIYKIETNTDVNELMAFEEH